jgi:uncharacterized membrane protein
MFSLYLVLKYVHIFSAIVAVGSNLTYGVWFARASTQAEQLGFALKGIKFIDDRIANPAYGVLFLTGLIMIFLGHWSITSFWIIVAIVLFIVLAGLGFAVASPQFRNQIRLVDAGDTSSPEFVRNARRGQILGPVLGVIVLVILAMMVFKPTL